MPKTAILLTGHIRTWSKCKDSFITNILEPNSNDVPDIFIRTYDIKNIGSSTYFTEQEIADMMVFTLKNGTTIVPKSITVVKHADYSVEITKEMEPIKGDVPEAGTYNLLSRVKNIYMGYETIKEYESKNGAYDVFMFTRFDMLYKGNVFFKDITDENTSYIHYTFSPDPNDEVVISLRKCAEFYVSRYPELFKSRYEHTWLGLIASDDGHLLYKYVLIKNGLQDWSWNNAYFAEQCKE